MVIFHNEWDNGTMWGPQDSCWFIIPSNYGYNYHKPKREIVVINIYKPTERYLTGPHIVV